MALAVALISARAREWSPVAVELFTCLVVAGVAYLLYAAVQTFAQGGTAVVVVGSVVLWLMELAALALTVSYAFEILDILGRRPRAAAIAADPATLADESPSRCRPTTSPSRWCGRPSRRWRVSTIRTSSSRWSTTTPATRRSGGRCATSAPSWGRASSSSTWSRGRGSRRGRSTRRPAASPRTSRSSPSSTPTTSSNPVSSPPSCGHFAAPEVAFVQSAQHYRDWEDDDYLRGLFYSFRYFFDVTMPAAPTATRSSSAGRWA